MTDQSPPRPAVRPRGYAKGAARRAQLLAVAVEVLGRVGYRSATMLQVAEAGGISRAGLLHHFPTKESLLEAVLADRDEADRRRSTAGKPGLAALAGLVEVMARNTTIPAVVNLFAVLSAEAGDPGHPAHAYFVARYARSRAGLEQSLTVVADQGLLRPGAEPAALAVELVALMDGLQVQWLLAPELVDMPGLLRARLESLLTVPLPSRTTTV